MGRRRRLDAGAGPSSRPWRRDLPRSTLLFAALVALLVACSATPAQRTEPPSPSPSAGSPTPFSASPSPSAEVATDELLGVVAFTDLFAHGIDWVDEGDECAGAGDYAAVREGGPVVVRDEANNVIATTSFYASQSDGLECYVFFRIEDLPRAAFYSFDAGGVVSETISFDELERNGWELRIIVNNDRARDP